jgi:hypothetical protein
MDLLENKEINDEVARHPWELGRFEIIKKNVQQVHSKMSKGSKRVLVDIGCGDAYVLRRLFGLFEFDRVVGVDVNFTDENRANLLKVNNKIEYLTHISQLNLDSTDQVMILLNDVIEHVEEHVQFLEELKSKLDSVEHCFVFITVPAYQFLFSQHDIDLGHFRRYKVRDLEAYSQQLKMHAQSKGYFFFSLFIIRALQKWVSGSMKIDPNASSNNEESIGVAEWNGSALLTGILTWFLRLDYGFLKLMSSIGIQLPGLSAYIVYSK